MSNAASTNRLTQANRSSAVLTSFKTAATRLLDACLDWHDLARQRRHLAALDDRMLADIGLCRADIERELQKPFWMG